MYQKNAQLSEHIMPLVSIRNCYFQITAIFLRANKCEPADVVMVWMVSGTLRTV